jgi:hypothetical protein
MRAVAISCILLAVAGLSCKSSQPTEAAGTAVELFDGKSLEGWKHFLVKPDVAMDEVWSVKDGILICKGDPLGYLRTTGEYTNFRLAVEWRWAPGTEPGNNGVLLRVNGEPTGVPRCIECQLKSGDAGDLYGFHGMKISGDPARMRSEKGHAVVGDLVGVSKTEAREKPAGEWNLVEIVADGSKVTVSVNGAQVNEATDCDVVAGPIALQSEGGEIHFRMVSLTPLE